MKKEQVNWIIKLAGNIFLQKKFAYPFEPPANSYSINSVIDRLREMGEQPFTRNVPSTDPQTIIFMKRDQWVASLRGIIMKWTSNGRWEHFNWIILIAEYQPTKIELIDQIEWAVTIAGMPLKRIRGFYILLQASTDAWFTIPQEWTAHASST